MERMVLVNLIASSVARPNAFPPLWLAVGSEGPVSQALAALSVAHGVPLIALSRLVAASLVELAPHDRPRRAPRLFQTVPRPARGPFTILDRTALLFLPELMLNPLQVLTELSRTHGPIVAAWCGAWDGAVLTYACPAHPEYRRYDHPAAVVVPIA